MFIITFQFAVCDMSVDLRCRKRLMSQQFFHTVDAGVIAGDAPAEAVALAEARTAARKAKDWAKADALRDELAALGWTVEDTAAGPKLVKKD